MTELDLLRRLFLRAVEVADPMRTIPAHLPPKPAGRTLIIGAGKASRALVRLSNGRVLTLRLGDKINGGTATSGSLSLSGGTIAMLIAYDATDWYSLPLLPS